jgi:hypothetical protein
MSDPKFDPTIDLDAARREGSFPDGIPVVFGGQTFTLPSELPLDIIDPLLADEFDLVGLVKELSSIEAETYSDTLVQLLTARPNLPTSIRDTFHDVLRLLFGAEAFADFQSHRPGLSTYALLIRRLSTAYGVSLGEAFASLASSATGGATSSTTSNESTASTPASSGDAPEPATASSVSAVSAHS